MFNNYIHFQWSKAIILAMMPKKTLRICGIAIIIQEIYDVQLNVLTLETYLCQSEIVYNRLIWFLMSDDFEVLQGNYFVSKGHKDLYSLHRIDDLILNIYCVIVKFLIHQSFWYISKMLGKNLWLRAIYWAKRPSLAQNQQALWLYEFV